MRVASLQGNGGRVPQHGPAREGGLDGLRTAAVEKRLARRGKEGKACLVRLWTLWGGLSSLNGGGKESKPEVQPVVLETWEWGWGWGGERDFLLPGRCSNPPHPSESPHSRGPGKEKKKKNKKTQENRAL